MSDGGAPDPTRPTLLILPMQVRGQSEGAEYAGQALAEGLAVNLSPAGGLQVLAVPDPGEVQGGTQDRLREARQMGASHLLVGALTRTPELDQLSLSLLESGTGRILWGVQKELAGSSQATLLPGLGREIASELGAVFPNLYDFPWKMAASDPLTSSQGILEAGAALRNGDIELSLESTADLVRSFPEIRAVHLRVNALARAKGQRDIPDLRAEFEKTMAILARADPGNPYEDYYRTAMTWLVGDNVTRLECLEGLTRLIERTGLTGAFRASILQLRADHLRAVGRIDEAIADMEEALDLEPTSAFGYCVLSGVYRADGQMDKALENARKALAISPWMDISQIIMGETLRLLGRPHEAVRYLAQAYETYKRHGYGQPQRLCAQYAMVLHQTGRESEALEIAEEGMALEAKRDDGLYYLACYWAVIGDRSRSLHTLEQALELGFSDLEITYDPAWNGLRGDPAFEGIVERVKVRVVGNPG